MASLFIRQPGNNRVLLFLVLPSKASTPLDRKALLLDAPDHSATKALTTTPNPARLTQSPRLATVQLARMCRRLPTRPPRTKTFNPLTTSNRTSRPSSIGTPLTIRTPPPLLETLACSSIRALPRLR